MPSQTILVTGANRGIGLSIVNRLAKRAPGNMYLLGVRSKVAGEQAAQYLRQQHVHANFEVLELDVTRNEDIEYAAQEVMQRYGKLDVLVNNAGMATITTQETPIADVRAIYNNVFDTNVTSVALLTMAFIPLLRCSPDPRVIFISSGRASMTALTTGNLPPTVSIPYSVSKLAMNALMLELSKQEEDVQEGGGSKILYQAANPGHCRTALNGFKGKRDPLEGVKIVEELISCDRETWGLGFWTWTGDEDTGEICRVAW